MNNPLSRALACPRLQQTFATLDRHRSNGAFDEQAALRLLYRNARDHTDTGRDTLAQRLYAEWSKRHTATPAERAYFDGDHCAHIAARDEHTRLARAMKLCHRATR